MNFLWRICGLCLFAYNSVLAADTLTISSPSGTISVKVWMSDKPMYRVEYSGQTIVDPSRIDMELEKYGNISGGIRSTATKKVSATIVSPVPEKRRNIPDVYNELLVNMKSPFSIAFRAYDDGVAYRISTRFKDSIVVKNEVAEFNFPNNPSAYFPEIAEKKGDMFMTSFEDTYNFKKIDEFPQTSIAYSPVLIVPENGPRIAITESDLEEYPGLFVTGSGKSFLKSVFARYPLEDSIMHAQYSQARVAKRADYVARTKGSRTFPWRVLIIAKEDKDLPSNDLVYRLASPSRVSDVSWVKPGNITDEWIIDLNLFNVPFRAGLNTASYKYYIDFASRFGFDRIMMDAGWSASNDDLLRVVPEIDMDTLVAYAKQKGVKIAMWTLALTLNRQLDSALDQFNKWGIDFIMTDFIDRDDQKAVNFHHRVAKACAEHKIMVMFHGSYPPKGFNRTYPNAVAREAVLGSEYNIWSDRVSPKHDVLLAFTRMLAGSLDYEPGLLNNAAQKRFRPAEGHVMSPGTRCHQLAMYAVYDSPIQFFSGNPSQGLQEPEFMELLAATPSIWDETKILSASVGEYIVTARQQGNNWWVGGMTDWTPRDMKISFDFLGEGNYQATICRDGINADRYGADYVIEKSEVNKAAKLKLHLAPGGGFFIRLEKK